MVLAVYASLSLAIDCEISDPKAACPAMLIMDEKGYVSKLPPGMEDDYIRSEQAFHLWLAERMDPYDNFFKSESLAIGICHLWPQAW
ncbi:conserved hypothetical protein [Ricinus communis]|uniref:Uncharacterized protein n=1 Tax=Ricinus communis TaxID=3988 RepID=B9RW26_RICCO|nr:conserved hypothetical protein [Ricinus communis]